MTSKLNDMAFQQSRQYAADYNEVVRRYQTQMDERLIGHWVDTTGVALNSTLNEFYDDLENSKSCFASIMGIAVTFYLVCKGKMLRTAEKH